VRPDPTNPTKPIFAGNYFSDNQPHTILYYVNKSDPIGPAPTDPSLDPQFNNWETALLGWAAKNPGVIQSGGGQIGFQPLGGPPLVQIVSPTAGSFASGDNINISAKISASQNITKISIAWNGTVVREFSGSFGVSYNFLWTFSPGTANPQNLLGVSATDQGGRTGEDSAIVYQ
jgi:hypothetical protein